MAAFYHSFDLCIIALSGERIPLLNTTVDAYNTTTSSSEGTVTSDEFGIVEEGSFTADAGDIVQFSVSGYPNTFEITLQATQELAYTTIQNAGNAFIVENLYTTTNETEFAGIYLTDDDDPTIPPQRIGTAKAGETAVIPYIATAQKNLTVHLISQSVKGQLSVTDFAKSTETYSITVPAPAGVKVDTLFDVFTDAPTTGTSRETLKTYAMPTGVLDHTGDKITTEYAGTFAANGNPKRIYVSFAGTDIGDSGALTENATDWQAKVTIIRASSTEARAAVSFASAVHHTPNYTAVTGLNLDATPYDLELDGHTSAGAGDLTLKMGHGMLIPRIPQNTFGTDAFGFSLEFEGGEIATLLNEALIGSLQLVFEPGEANHFVFPSDPPDDPFDYGDPILEPPEA
jgi:hypothetical protein